MLNSPTSAIRPLATPITSISNGQFLTEKESVMAVSRDSLVHAVGGAVGSALALALLYPLDQLRTFQQVDDHYLREGCSQKNAKFGYLGNFLDLIDRHGKGVLYRGIIPMLVSMSISNFVYFYVYNVLKKLLAQYKRRTGNDFGYLGNLAIATVAGIINVFATTPFWVVSTRAKLKVHQAENTQLGMIQMLLKIKREEGTSALWSGTIPSLLLVCNPVIQFVVYDALKAYSLGEGANLRGGDKGLNTIQAFMYGGIAKGVATVTSYPLQVAQSRLRMQEEGLHAAPYHGTLDCLLTLWQNSGFKGLFQGIESKLLQTVLTSAFMFVAYEKILQLTKVLVIKKAAKAA